MAFTIGTRIGHPSFGEGVIFGMDDQRYRIFFKDHGEKELGKAFDGYRLLEPGPSVTSSVELEDVVAAVQNVFDQYYEVSEIVELGDRWEKGTLQ
ncbi:MAG: hypothetical protein IT223_05825, partial [Crocinitomicaceae bacterium]|nr:hypothetical protein [Crocinitomicaceae bacterium]